MPNIIDAIRRMTNDLKSRVALMISRAVIESVKDSGNLQVMQVSVLKDETKDDVERFQNFGFTGNPPAGSEAIGVSVGGNREHMVIIACDDRRVRLTGLQPGESAMYNDKGNKAHLKSNEEFEILLEKLKVENSTAELIDLIVQWLEKQIEIADTLSTTTTNTIFGPMQLNDFSFFATKKTELEELKTKLESFKV